MNLYLLILYLVFPEWGSTASSVDPTVITRLDALEQQLQKLSSDVKGQETKATSSVRAILAKTMQNEAELSDLKTQLANVKNEQQATNQEMALLKAQLNITSTTFSDIQKDVNVSRKEVDVIKNVNSATAGRVDSLESSLRVAEMNLTWVKTHLIALTGAEGIAEQNVTLAKAQIHGLNSRLNNTDSILGLIVMDSSRVKKDISDLKADQTTIENTLRKVETSIISTEIGVNSRLNNTDSILGLITRDISYLKSNQTTIEETLGKVETSLIKAEIGASVVKTRLDRLENKTNTNDERDVERDDRNRKEILKYPDEMTSSRTNVDYRLFPSLIHKLGDGKAEEDRETDGPGSGSAISGRSRTSNCVEDMKQTSNNAAQLHEVGRRQFRASWERS